MPENLFKEEENPPNTGNQTKGGMTPSKGGVAPEAMESVEPGTTDK